MTATLSFSPPTYPRPVALIKSPVTLIVGILARDGIVFGADSQTTHDDEKGTKSLDTLKIHLINFGDRTVIVGEAGDVANASITLEEFRALAAKAENTDPVARIFDQALC